jgi:hypothetical protein
MHEKRKRPTMPVPEAGRRYFGLGRNASYDAARRGEIPTLCIGSRLFAVVAELDRMVGAGNFAPQPERPAGDEPHRERPKTNFWQEQPTERHASAVNTPLPNRPAKAPRPHRGPPKRVSRGTAALPQRPAPATPQPHPRGGPRRRSTVAGATSTGTEGQRAP